jgi:DMSO/TMAO reductase YedYZ molybdopterin-dependent catalytic subunit
MRPHRRVIALGALALAALLAVAVASAVLPAGPGVAQAEDPVVLTLTGNDQTKEYTLSQVQALPVYSGYAGQKNSAGTITPAVPVKGVKLEDLFAGIGGMTDQQACDILAIDDYGMEMRYEEAIGGDFDVYDETTGVKEDPDSPLSAVLIYERDGVPITYENGGPLRIAICQTEDVGQVADGHWLVKWVNRITLRDALPDWTVKMFGLKRKNGTRQTSLLDRASYISCSAPGCHGRAWVGSTGGVWTGVNLSYIMGRVDGGRAHGDDAFNASLAMRGYRIKLVSATGKYVIISSRTMMRSKRIILANKKNGVVLGQRYYPLRLVGPSLDTSKFIGRITRIYMLPK